MLESGYVVKSLSGRDKDRLLLVVAVSDDGRTVFVCDGKERPLKRPKKKNEIHLRDTGKRLEDVNGFTDRALKKALAAIEDDMTVGETP